MTTLNSRLDKLEKHTGSKNLSSNEMMLRALRAGGFDGACAMFAADDECKSRVPMPFGVLMNVMDDGGNPFNFESYRGLVPDEVIRQAYSFRRNYVYGPATQDRVRQMAGVINADRNVAPGYTLTASGNIVEAFSG